MQQYTSFPPLSHIPSMPGVWVMPRRVDMLQCQQKMLNQVKNQILLWRVTYWGIAYKRNPFLKHKRHSGGHNEMYYNMNSIIIWILLCDNSYFPAEYESLPRASSNMSSNWIRNASWIAWKLGSDDMRELWINKRWEMIKFVSLISYLVTDSCERNILQGVLTG